MRRILIDHARGNQAEMRGGGIVHVPLSEELSWVDVGSPELLDLDRVLDELGAIDPHKVQLVELRYFLGIDRGRGTKLLHTRVSKTGRVDMTLRGFRFRWRKSKRT